jgi:cytochrome c oxidase cbb3-type subunit 3
MNDCHAVDARGDSAIGAPGLMGPSWIYGDGSRQALSASIAQGRHGVCPAWIDRFNPTAIREVAMYIYALSRPLIHGGRDERIRLCRDE